MDIDGHSKLLENLILEMKKTKRITEPYFHKREAFQHEHERRIILLDKENSRFLTGFPSQAALNKYRRESREKNLTKEQAILLISDEIRKTKYPFSKENTLSEVSVGIPDLPYYIKSVMVHPQTEPWIVTLVDRICKRVNLTFVGKSHMYDGIS